MPLTLLTIPCLSDNYAFAIHNPSTEETALIDVPEAGPINSEIEAKGWSLSQVFLTHHHPDHVQGLSGLKGDFEVIGAQADRHRLPDLDHAVAEGDTVKLAGADAQIFDVSGHTKGHIAAYLPEAGLLFSADSLMALGCGRLFEGDAEMMWTSLQKLRDLPDATLVCSGHEYTLTNARFALSIDPDNAALQTRAREVEEARAKGQPTVPSALGIEKATNPFLRADDPDLAAALGMENADPVHVFAEIRRRRDIW